MGAVGGLLGVGEGVEEGEGIWTQSGSRSSLSWMGVDASMGSDVMLGGALLDVIDGME